MRRFLLFPLFFVLLVTAVCAATDDNIPVPVTQPAQAFTEGAIVVRGEGAAPQDAGYSSLRMRLLALRAAKVAAFREAAEMINGVLVSGDTTVFKASSRSDRVSTSVVGLVRGAQVVKEIYDPQTASAVVYLSVSMTGEGGLVGELMPGLAPMYRSGLPMYQPLAGAAAASYDGLIIDVRAKPFKPALINRVVTAAGEVVYDPATVTREVLIERGGAAYTNGIDRARAILKERGSKNPLIVSAASVIKSTDVVISPEAAGAVAMSNQSSGFLDGAQVVFVLE